MATSAETVNALRRLHELYEAPETFRWAANLWVYSGPHSFPFPDRQTAAQMLGDIAAQGRAFRENIQAAQSRLLETRFEVPGRWLAVQALGSPDLVPKSDGGFLVTVGPPDFDELRGVCAEIRVAILRLEAAGKAGTDGEEIAQAIPDPPSTVMEFGEWIRETRELLRGHENEPIGESDRNIGFAVRTIFLEHLERLYPAWPELYQEFQPHKMNTVGQLVAMMAWVEKFLRDSDARAKEQAKKGLIGFSRSTPEKPLTGIPETDEPARHSGDSAR